MLNEFCYVVLGIICLFIINAVRTKLHNRKKQNMNIMAHKQYLEYVHKEFYSNHEVKKPNIIVFFMDDMGYADISYYGAKNIKTPNIDSLSENGVKMNCFYSCSPVCSPSRAGLLTGRHPLRMLIPHVFFPSKSFISKFIRVTLRGSHGVKGLLEDEITIAEVLNEAGYKTGLLGKWHLGDKSPHLPNDKGFEFFYGALYSNDMKPYAIWRNRKIEQPSPANQDNLTKYLTNEAISFIRKNANKPFFLHYCKPFPHDPLHASRDFQGTSNAGLYGDAVQEIDWSVGEILKTLHEFGLREKTLIIFTSDNGPWHEGNPGFHRGRKGLPFEGGQRVPFIVSFLSVLPKGITINEMAMNTDIFPSILNLIGIPLPDDRIIDGKDLIPLLSGVTPKSPHEH
jgi:arylsulfatase A